MNNLTRAFCVGSSTKGSIEGCNGSLDGAVMHNNWEGSGNGFKICLCRQSDDVWFYSGLSALRLVKIFFLDTKITLVPDYGSSPIKPPYT